jgi:adiponectin receptor
LLIVTSFFPIVYYSFQCQPAFTHVYLGIITVLGAAAIVMSLGEVFQRPEWRATRAGLYVGLGAMGVVPLLHVWALHSDVWHVRQLVALDVAMGACYMVRL